MRMVPILIKCCSPLRGHSAYRLRTRSARLAKCHGFAVKLLCSFAAFRLRRNLSGRVWGGRFFLAKQKRHGHFIFEVGVSLALLASNCFAIQKQNPAFLNFSALTAGSKTCFRSEEAQRPPCSKNEPYPAPIKDIEWGSISY